MASRQMENKLLVSSSFFLFSTCPLTHLDERGRGKKLKERKWRGKGGAEAILGT